MLVGSAEPSLDEICQEMSELLDKQVNVQRYVENFQGSCKPKKRCAIKKNITHL